MDHVQDPEAYARAVKARIKANAAIGRRRRFEVDNPDAAALEAFIRSRSGEFYASLRQGLLNWGDLTARQLEIVRKHMAEAAERTAAKRALDAGSRFQGTVGERLTISGTVQFVSSFEGDFGYVHITSIKDDAGNVYVQKGARIAGKGIRLTLKATVKAHEVYQGVKQTRINRAKVQP